MNFGFSLFLGRGFTPFGGGFMSMPFFRPMPACSLWNMGLSIPPALPYVPFGGDFGSYLDMPLMRDTSADIWLNPQLAMRQAPSMPFGQMPTIPGLDSWNPAAKPAKPETAEEKKEREAKEAKEKEEKEAKTKRDNEAKIKNDSYKQVFDKLSEVMSINSSDYKILKAEYDQAIAETDEEKRLEKLKTLFGKIKPEYLRKAILETDDVKMQLIKAGYNFPDSKNPLITTSNGNAAIDFEGLHSEIESKKASALLPQITARLDAGRNETNDVLLFLSTWNNKYPSEKGFLRTIATNMPSKVQDQTIWKKACVAVANALSDKADNFITENGTSQNFKKLTGLKNKVTDALKPINESRQNAITEGQVTKLADACDKLYAYLRIQEAKVADRAIKQEFAADMNAVKAGTIKDNMILEDTKTDLKSEGINVPADKELDELPKQESALDVSAAPAGPASPAGGDDEGDEQDWTEEDDADGESRVAYLTGEDVQALTKHTSTNGKTYYRTQRIYAPKTKETLVPAKFYAVVGDKLVEVKQNKQGKYTIPTTEEEVKDSKDVTIQEVLDYQNTTAVIKDLIASKKIEKVAIVPNKNRYVYKSTKAESDGKIHWYLLRGNKLYEIKDCKNVDEKTGRAYFNKKGQTSILLGDKKIADHLVEYGSQTETEPEEEEKPAATEEQAELKTNVDISSIESVMCSLDELGLEQTAISGWFTTSDKKKVYRYDGGKLVEEKGVTEINSDGTIKRNNRIEYVTEVEKPNKSGKDLRRALYAKTSDYSAAKKELNNFLKLETAEEVIEFYEGYEDERSWNNFINSKMCAQIYTEKGFKKKEEYLRKIASKMAKLMRTEGYEEGDDDYDDMMHFATTFGNTEKSTDIFKNSRWRRWWSWGPNMGFVGKSPLLSAAKRMDDIIENFIKKYRENHPDGSVELATPEE